MTYQQTLDWLFVQLPMYQKQGGADYKIDLSKAIGLVTYLGNPEKKFKTIHVAGTNGKGSTSHMLASVLQEAGYKVGLYTSPHLKDFRERIRINGSVVEEQFVTEFVEKHKTYFENHQLSFFEMTVGMAFAYFAMEQIDVAVIEVGLGGRLDATNVVTPEISVITNIGLDHTNFLGTTLAEIAAEKAGIIKSKIPVVIGSSVAATQRVFEEVAKEQSSRLYEASKYTKKIYSSDLKGSYQKENSKTVLQTLEILIEKGWGISEDAIASGLSNVMKNTGLLGRWQILQEHPKVICDTGHNAEGLRYVFEQLQAEQYRNLHCVIGVVDDKDLSRILPLFPKDARYYFAKPEISRGLDATILQQKAQIYGLQGMYYSDVEQAYKTALSIATPDDVVFVGGSTFVVAEVV